MSILSRGAAARRSARGDALDDREIRFAGQEVAAVAAISPGIAADALELIKVDYEPLPFVVDMDAAVKDSAPRVFGSGSQRRHDQTLERRRCRRRDSSSAANTIEAIYTTPVQTHVCARNPRRGRELQSGRR